MGFFEGLKEGLRKTRDGILGGLDMALGDYSRVDDDFFDELEEILIMADVGAQTSDRIVSRMKERVWLEHLKEPAQVKKALAESIASEMKMSGDDYDLTKGKSVILMVGVNGTGKTTTTGKLSLMLRDQGQNVIIAAADTFRAGAIEQLRVWAERSGADFVAGKEGSDPAAVIYEAVDKYISGGYDVLICDTAGRLHNKKNLMDELEKIGRIIDRKLPDIHKEVLLVLDATTGQNAISQVKEFREACEPSGIVLTKLDGSAKGGIVIALSSEFDIPVKYIGIGEKATDIAPFDAQEFLRAVFEV